MHISIETLNGNLSKFDREENLVEFYENNTFDISYLEARRCHINFVYLFRYSKILDIDVVKNFFMYKKNGQLFSHQEENVNVINLVFHQSLIVDKKDLILSWMKSKLDPTSDLYYWPFQSFINRKAFFSLPIRKINALVSIFEEYIEWESVSILLGKFLNKKSDLILRKNVLRFIKKYNKNILLYILVDIIEEKNESTIRFFEEYFKDNLVYCNNSPFWDYVAHNYELSIMYIINSSILLLRGNLLLKNKNINQQELQMVFSI